MSHIELNGLGIYNNSKVKMEFPDTLDTEASSGITIKATLCKSPNSHVVMSFTLFDEDELRDALEIIADNTWPSGGDFSNKREALVQNLHQAYNIMK